LRANLARQQHEAGSKDLLPGFLHGLLFGSEDGGDISSEMLWRKPSKETHKKKNIPLTLLYIYYFKSYFIKTFQPLY
jgi:hypothetical protein